MKLQTLCSSAGPEKLDLRIERPVDGNSGPQRIRNISENTEEYYVAHVYEEVNKLWQREKHQFVQDLLKKSELSEQDRALPQLCTIEQLHLPFGESADA